MIDRDLHTTTVEDAARFEAERGRIEDFDDRPTLAELEREEWEAGRRTPHYDGPTITVPADPWLDVTIPDEPPF